VYSTADMDLGLIHLGPNLSNTNSNVGFPSAPCYSTDCPAGEWDLIAGNPPLSVAFDCRSDLYVLAGTNARAVVKFINQAPVPSSSCSPLLQRASMLSGITVFPRFGVNGRSGKASVLIGCQTRLCVGTVTLRSSSPLCRRCLLTTPLHIRIQPGVEKTVSLYLDRLGRRLLRQHPGLPIQVFGKLKGGRTVAESERLREPAALTDSCRFPGAPGGDASISGSLTPSHGQERISLEYVPPEAAGVFLPAVQRSVLTYASGRFADHYALGEAGRWTVIVSWGGDSTREPATAPVCVGAVQKAATQLTISCPSPSSIGTPGMFMGRLAGAPADASVAVVYEAPSGLLVAHDVTVGSGGDFSDAFAPTVAGNWKALGNYNGDADHEPTRASCAFTVPQPAPTSLSLDCTPDPDAHYISCLGSLELSGSGIGGAPISITYQPSAPGTSTIDSATTLADGSYGDTLSVAASGPPLAAGLWTVQAHYAGTSAYGPSSNSQNVTVP